jgi:hypothetical protein
MAAHAVDTSARRGRRRAQEQPWHRRRPRDCSDRGPEHGLPERRLATADVTADEVRVLQLELAWAANRSGNDDIAEPRREALDLLLHRRGRVAGIAVRNVTVGPRGMATRRSPRRVEEGVMGEQHERPTGELTRSNRTRRCSNVFERAAQVHSARPRTLWSTPRNRSGERVVHLEGARPLRNRPSARR